VDGDEFGDLSFLGSGGGAVKQVFFRYGKHAAGTAGGIVDGKVAVGNGDFEKLDHQADDFAGGEVVSGLFAALFGEAPEDLFVYVAHFEAGELVGAEREFFVLVEDGGEAVVLHHLTDGGAVVEVFDDVVDVFGEPVDVAAEVVFEEGVVFFVDFAKGPASLVREGRQLGVEFEFLDEFGKVFFRQVRAFGEDFGATGFAPGEEDAFEAAVTIMGRMTLWYS